MPSPTTGTVLSDDPRIVEKIRLKLSADMKNKGKSGMRHPITGVAPSDASIADAEILTSQLLPSSYAIPTPPIENQGQEGACVAFAGAIVRDIAWYKLKNATSYSTTVNVFSTEYIYNQCKAGNCASGTGMTTVLNLFYNQGVCLSNTMPYSDVECDTLPDGSQRAEAVNYKIANYSRFIVTDIIALKQELYNNRAIMFPLIVDNAFVSATTGFIWSPSTISEGYVGHCVALIGWDDTKNAFKIQNSWGTGWGDSGYGWVDYVLCTDQSYSKVGYYCYGNLQEIVSGTLPVANAGFDQNIPSGSTVLLDGAGSSDPDGYITAYLWEKVSGPSSPTILNSTSPVASIVPTTVGTYVYKLTVTDNGTNTASDTVTVIISVLETYTVAVTKSVMKGKAQYTLTWNISLNSPAQLATIQLSLSNPNTWNTLYDIVPYSPAGTYSYTPPKSSQLKYYRLKVVKSDDTIVYSPIVSIK
jgi:hypothetical protein